MLDTGWLVGRVFYYRLNHHLQVCKTLSRLLLPSLPKGPTLQPYSIPFWQAMVVFRSLLHTYHPTLFALYPLARRFL